MQAFNYVDLIVFGIFVLSSLIGIARGFTREFFGVIAWIGALGATLFGIVASRPLVQGFITNPFIADIVSGLFIFIITLFLLGSLSRYLSLKVKASLLGGLDRSLGLVFGLARAAALLVIAYFVTSVVWNPEKWPEELKQSRAIPHLRDWALWLKDAIPKDLLKNLGLKSEEKEEEAEFEQSIDRVVFALSQPQSITSSGKEASKQGYETEQRDELNRLVEKDGQQQKK